MLKKINVVAVLLPILFSTSTKADIPAWTVTPPAGHASYCADVKKLGKDKAMLVAKTFAKAALEEQKIVDYVVGDEVDNSGEYSNDIQTTTAAVVRNVRIVDSYQDNHSLCVLVTNHAN